MIIVTDGGVCNDDSDRWWCGVFDDDSDRGWFGVCDDGSDRCCDDPAPKSGRRRVLLCPIALDLLL